MKPNNPYSSSKASSNLILNSFINTYKINCIILNPANNFGIFQYPEKFIPRSILLFIKKGYAELYGNGNQIRDWISVKDTVRAIMFLMNKKNISGETFSISSNYQISNKQLLKKIIKYLQSRFNKKFNLRHVRDRPGHDFKYSSSIKKLKTIGWIPKFNFEKELINIIDWYLKKKNYNYFNKISLKRIGIIKK